LFICVKCDNYENTQNIGINILRKYLEDFDYDFNEYLNDLLDCHDIHGYQLSEKQKYIINKLLTRKIYQSFDEKTKDLIIEYKNKKSKSGFIDDDSKNIIKETSIKNSISYKYDDNNQNYIKVEFHPIDSLQISTKYITYDAYKKNNYNVEKTKYKKINIYDENDKFINSYLNTNIDIIEEWKLKEKEKQNIIYEEEQRIQIIEEQKNKNEIDKYNKIQNEREELNKKKFINSYLNTNIHIIEEWKLKEIEKQNIIYEEEQRIRKKEEEERRQIIEEQKNKNEIDKYNKIQNEREELNKKFNNLFTSKNTIIKTSKVTDLSAYFNKKITII
jgi:hypothetical protein